MFKKFTLSAALAALIATTVSAAFAAPKTIPETGAEKYQSQSNVEDMGQVPGR
jgi:hypothetical protein